MRTFAWTWVLVPLFALGCGDEGPGDVGFPDSGSSGGDTGPADLGLDVGARDGGLDGGADLGEPDAEPTDGPPADTGLDAGAVDAEPGDVPQVDAAPNDGGAGPGPAECAPSELIDLNVGNPPIGTPIVTPFDNTSRPLLAELPPPSCTATVGFVQVFRYAPQSDSRITVSTVSAGTGVDTVVWAIRPCANPSEEFGCNDDSSGSQSSLVLPFNPAGVPIFIAVGASASVAGPPVPGPIELSVLEETFVLEACDFSGGPVCPEWTRCNGRSLTPGVQCVPAWPAGVACDPSEFLPANTCVAPNVCNRVGTSTITRCVPPPFTESSAAITFEDACANGTIVPGLTDLDEGNTLSALTLPFVFDYFGAGYTEVWASTNGYAVLGPGGPVNATFGLPAFGEGPAIAPFWDDLVMDGPGARLCTQALPNDRFVIEWENAYRSGRFGAPPNPMRLTFELILNGADGSVDFVYRTLEPSSGPNAEVANGLNAHLGLQSAFAAEWVVHDGPIASGDALHFAP